MTLISSPWIHYARSPLRRQSDESYMDNGIMLLRAPALARAF